MPQPPVTTGLPTLLFESDDALLGNIKKEFDSFAMRPAAFPSFLPGDSLGMASIADLPQPVLTTLSSKQGSMGGAAGLASDQLGLF